MDLEPRFDCPVVLDGSDGRNLPRLRHGSTAGIEQFGAAAACAWVARGGSSAA